MSIVRAQVRLPFTSGLPEDLSTNTFHFSCPNDGDATERADIADRIEDYYGFVGGFLSAMISRANASIRFYDLAQPEPRVPLEEIALPLPNAGVATSLPSEVALVHSYRALYTSGSPSARRRNRVYLGPLSTSATTATNNQFARPSTGLMTACLSAGASLADDSLSTGVRWCAYSPTDDAGLVVIEQWVNNEFDTQRRRGTTATVRDSLPVTQP